MIAALFDIVNVASRACGEGRPTQQHGLLRCNADKIVRRRANADGTQTETRARTRPDSESAAERRRATEAVCVVNADLFNIVQ
jgi:hypothetical protein